MSDAEEQFNLRAANFDVLYQGGRLMDGVEFTTIPWDIGRAQPAVMEFERAGRIRGNVLEVGCGLGENAIFLADHGYRVTAVDIAPTAVERARRLAGERGVEVEFAVADATSLAGYEDQFDSVLDSACYHCLDVEQQRLYAAALHRATKPGALLNLFCFTNDGGGMPAWMSVSEENLRTTLSSTGWTITDLSKITYLGAGDLGDIGDQFGLHFTPDETGHLQIPVWAVQAHRA